MLQQEIAEELERERKRNKKELSALQHTNATIMRQRDESRRVVLHLRSLIDGQTHHMEHIVRSLNQAPELSDYIEEGYEDAPEDAEDPESITSGERNNRLQSPELVRSLSGESSVSEAGQLDQEAVAPDMESRLFSSLTPSAGRPGNRLSIADIADRHLRDKTDAIAYIIRNISDQCAAAVEGLHLAQTAEHEEAHHERLDPDLPGANRNIHKHTESDGNDSMHTDASQLGASENGDVADSGHGGSTGFLTPNEESGIHSRSNSIPPTPDLVSGGRSSTSMSGYSNSTAPTQHGRDSQQWGIHSDVGKRLRIVEAEESVGDDGSETGHHEENLTKRASDSRPVTARIVN